MNAFKHLHRVATSMRGGLRFDHPLVEALKVIDDRPPLPRVVCLCGSTRFKDAFLKANKELTHQGNIVLSVGSLPDDLCERSSEDIFGEDVKQMLDQLHKRKIDLADEILVLNVGGYIGKSTQGEIDYAIATNTQVSYLEVV